MSEELLKAIIQLLAIVAKEDQVTADERDTIEKFLSENLNKEEVQKYLKLFDKLTADIVKSPSDNIDEKAEIDSITKNVNQEFTTQQKVVVMLVLMELIMADAIITKREDVLLYYIGNAFNVPKDEIDQIKNYVVHHDKANLSSSDIVVIDNGEHDKPPKSKHLKAKNMDGFIAIQRIKSAEIYFMKYIGSTVLTLNGIPLQRDQSIQILSPGSSIRGNKVRPIYFSDIVSTFRDEAIESPISFTCENVNFKFKNGHIGLRNINIAESGGKIIGLMGGSGAGKSTLMNVLNGNETPTEGSVRINGVDIHKDKKKIDGVIGYVPQDDLLMEDLTVFQNLYFAAKLCFNHLNYDEIEELVTKTLSSLGLSETRDLKVGSPLEKTISGGQRKRLNIGLELLREPAVLFVDEPTSGLSSRDSENIMDLLKELSLKGKMIFVVIHQPSSDIYKMFDKMVILDVGGYQIYYGNPVEAVTYFKTIVNMIDKEVGSCFECGNVNPEQIFNIIETKVVNEYGKFTDQRKISPETWNEYFNKKIKVRKVEEHSEKPKVSLHIPNKIKQAVIFTLRDVKSKLSNKQYLTINLLEAPVLAVLLAYIVRYIPSENDTYWFSENENIPAFFFISIIVALFMGLTVSAEEIIKDRKILKRESFLNLSRLSYVFSKLLILFSLSALQTIMFVVIGNSILGIESMTTSFWVILFSISCFANTLGLNISSAFNSEVYNEGKEFLRALKKVHSNRYNKASSEKDVFISGMNPEEKMSFDLQKKLYENEQIRFFVRNTGARSRITEENGELVRKIYPIYMDPIPSNPIDFREQFYFPSKHFLGINYDTKNFNVIMIWVQSILLIVTLYFDIFRKIVEGFSFTKMKK